MRYKSFLRRGISPSVSFADSSLVRGSQCGMGSIDDSFKAMQKGFSLFLFRYFLNGFGFVRESEAKYDRGGVSVSHQLFEQTK